MPKAEVKKKRKAWYHWMDVCRRRAVPQFEEFERGLGPDADLTFHDMGRTGFTFLDYDFHGDFAVWDQANQIRSGLSEWLEEDLKKRRKGGK